MNDNGQSVGHVERNILENVELEPQVVTNVAKKGHFIKDCSFMRDDHKEEEPKKTNARVFTITQADANAGTSGYLGK